MSSPAVPEIVDALRQLRDEIRRPGADPAVVFGKMSALPAFDEKKTIRASGLFATLEIYVFRAYIYILAKTSESDMDEATRRHLDDEHIMGAVVRRAVADASLRWHRMSSWSSILSMSHDDHCAAVDASLDAIKSMAPVFGARFSKEQRSGIRFSCIPSRAAQEAFDAFCSWEN